MMTTRLERLVVLVVPVVLVVLEVPEVLELPVVLVVSGNVICGGVSISYTRRPAPEKIVIKMHGGRIEG